MKRTLIIAERENGEIVPRIFGSTEQSSYLTDAASLASQATGAKGKIIRAPIALLAEEGVGKNSLQNYFWGKSSLVRAALVEDSEGIEIVVSHRGVETFKIETEKLFELTLSASDSEDTLESLAGSEETESEETESEETESEETGDNGPEEKDPFAPQGDSLHDDGLLNQMGG